MGATQVVMQHWQCGPETVFRVGCQTHELLFGFKPNRLGGGTVVSETTYLLPAELLVNLLKLTRVTFS
jgi:hypothetical protein